MDPMSGRHYYYNLELQLTQWAQPPEQWAQPPDTETAPVSRRPRQTPQQTKTAAAGASGTAAAGASGTAAAGARAGLQQHDVNKFFKQ
jgi:hypothetical protein